MTTYRWNLNDFAVGYDQSAHHVHPHYLAVQDAVLAALPFGECDEFLLVDAGGGSGRLVEKFLDRFTNARAIVLDQSEAFLALAERKLARFGERASCRIARLQGDWPREIGVPAGAVVSMSAIHHLVAAEKQQLFAQIYDALAPGGVFINGDEVRPAGDDEYFTLMSAWAKHMHQIIDARLVPESFQDALLKWEARNVTAFGKPKQSGDDCHDTIEQQLAWFAECGFVNCRTTWRRDLWAVVVGEKTK
jgi:tRNA (cmo5U34)-methyltransferase